MRHLRIHTSVLTVFIAIGAFYFTHGFVRAFTASAFELSTHIIDVGKWNIGWGLLLQASAIVAGIVSSLLVIVQLTTRKSVRMRSFAWVSLIVVGFVYAFFANHTLTHWLVFTLPIWMTLLVVQVLILRFAQK